MNLRGGLVLLGVEDDGTVGGLTRSAAEAEQWVMNICQQNVKPGVIAYWAVIEWEPNRWIGAITLRSTPPIDRTKSTT